MATNVITLLQDVQKAYDALKEKTLAREQASAVAAAAAQDETKAADNLKALQGQLNSILGQVLPAADGRVRVSS